MKKKKKRQQKKLTKEVKLKKKTCLVDPFISAIDRSIKTCKPFAGLHPLRTPEVKDVKPQVCVNSRFALIYDLIIYLLIYFSLYWLV